MVDDDWETWKHLKGSGRGLTEVLSRNFNLGKRKIVTLSVYIVILQDKISVDPFSLEYKSMSGLLHK
jgi:hypothetical protein